MPRCRKNKLVSSECASNRTMTSNWPAPPWTALEAVYLAGSVCAIRWAKGSCALNGKTKTSITPSVSIFVSPSFFDRWERRAVQLWYSGPVWRGFISATQGLPLIHVEQQNGVVLARQHVLDGRPDPLMLC